ncbi:hypothetical protein ACQ4LE_001473 [Meloidogyne hapla]|uniref:Ovule protein n=1 Tax=Meloidogyne hapla TaxID=6305 RepID=A0A1I8BEA0_MELHA
MWSDGHSFVFTSQLSKDLNDSLASQNKNSNNEKVRAPDSSKSEVLTRQPSMVKELMYSRNIAHSLTSQLSKDLDESKNSSNEEVRAPDSSKSEVISRQPSTVELMSSEDGHSFASQSPKNIDDSLAAESKNSSNEEVRAPDSSKSEVINRQPSMVELMSSEDGYSFASQSPKNLDGSLAAESKNSSNDEVRAPDYSKSEVINRQPSPVKELMYSRKPSLLLELFFLGIGTCALFGLVFVGYRNFSKKSG